MKDYSNRWLLTSGAFSLPEVSLELGLQTGSAGRRKREEGMLVCEQVCGECVNMGTLVCICECMQIHKPECM